MLLKNVMKTPSSKHVSY